MFARSNKAMTQALRRLCPLFADPTQDGDKQTGLRRTLECPISGIADERADMAISTRLTHTGKRAAGAQCQRLLDPNAANR